MNSQKSKESRDFSKFLSSGENKTYRNETFQTIKTLLQSEHSENTTDDPLIWTKVYVTKYNWVLSISSTALPLQGGGYQNYCPVNGSNAGKTST